MKILRKGAAVLGLCLFRLADVVAQVPAVDNSVAVLWEVPTNHVPPSVWVYRIVPQTFPPIIVSNLMCLGGFTGADEIKLNGQTLFSRYFENKETMRKLGIVPDCGFVFYEDPNAKASLSKHEHPAGVPSDEEAYRLGLTLIQKLGIDRSDLVTKGEGGEIFGARGSQTVGWTESVQHTNGEEVLSRSVDFVRRKNGINFGGLGRGGVAFEFGNNGKLARLQMLWRGLEPFELHPTIEPDKIVQEVRTGKGQWIPHAPAGTLRAITIYDAKPLYHGVLESDEEQKFLQPCVELKTHVETTTTNIALGFVCSVY